MSTLLTLTFARSRSEIIKAWEERGEKLSPEIKIDIDSTQLTPKIRKYISGSAGLQSTTSYSGSHKFTQGCYINFNESVMRWPTLTSGTTNGEIITLLEAAIDEHIVASQTKRQKEEEAKREREEKKQTEEREKAARTENLRSWAQEHGSLLLKERIAGGFSWAELAETEFNTQHLPAGFIPVNDDSIEKYKDRTIPDLTEIQALKNAQREFILPIYRDVRLVLVTPTDDRDREDQYDEESEAPEDYAGIYLEVLAPNGATLGAIRKI